MFLDCFLSDSIYRRYSVMLICCVALSFLRGLLLYLLRNGEQTNLQSKYVG